MHTLDIIIPQYYGETVIEKLFETLNTQIGVDFERVHIIVVNDCNPDTVLSSRFLSRYSHLKNISLISTQVNSGPGVSRQTGIDFGTGDYIIFIDEDDYLADGTVLFRFFQAMQSGKDVYHSYMLSNGRAIEPTTIWTHGKMFKRRFLQKNNIQFSPNVRIGEDIYFNLLADGVVALENKEKIPYTTYVWVNNPLSLTRIDSSVFRSKSYTHWFASMIELMKEFEDRNLQTKCVELYLLVFYKAYFFTNLPVEPAGFKDSMAFFKQFYKLYKHYYSEATDSQKTKTFNLAKEESIMQGFIKEKMTINFFVKQLENNEI